MRRPVVLCILASNCLLAQPFFFRKDIPIGERPYALAVGDFNGDGRPDLALSTWDGLVILLNSGSGNFGRPIRTEALGFGSVAAAADFNGDGKDDLVGSAQVLLSRGDGTFLPPLPIGDTCNAVAAGDFNRDGKSDLVCDFYETTEGGGQTLKGTRVLLGNGDGTFRAGPTLTAEFRIPLPPLVADFNRDGRSDVAMFLDYRASPTPVPPGNPPLALMVFPGQGDGTFGPGIQTPMDKGAGWIIGTFSMADFNGDRVPDLATPYGVMLGNGDGTFQGPVPYTPSAKDVLPMAAADLTGDGKADLVGGRSNSVFTFPGKGDGSFLPPTEQAVGWGPHVAAAVDVDGDGRLDLVTANFWEANTVSILLARPQAGPALRRAVSAASETAIVASGSLATLFAPTPATASATASPPWPTRLGGLGLEVRDSAGATRLAPLLFVSSTQVNFQVPAGTAPGEGVLTVVTDRGAAEAGSMQVDAAAPGLFMISHQNQVPAATGVRVERDGTQVPVPVFTCSASSCKTEPIPLSSAGDRPIYLSFYGTGFSGASPENVTCSIYGVPVPVLYAGPQGLPGLDQINVRLLPELLEEIEGQLVGPKTVTVTFRINGIVSNSAVIDVR